MTVGGGQYLGGRKVAVEGKDPQVMGAVSER
jgi:hypothetical protein